MRESSLGYESGCGKVAGRVYSTTCMEYDKMNYLPVLDYTKTRLAPYLSESRVMITYAKL